MKSGAFSTSDVQPLSASGDRDGGMRLVKLQRPRSNYISGTFRWPSCRTLLCLSNEHSCRRLETIFLWRRFRLRLPTVFMGDLKCSFAQSQGNR